MATVSAAAPRRGLLLPLAAALLGLAPAARAQLDLTFTPPALGGVPGQTLTYAGTLTNLGAGDLFLNGDTFTLPGAGLTLDDTPLLTDFPLSLGAHQSASGALFTVTIDPTVPVGVYTGSFTVLGGPGANDATPLATRPFAVNVPEPGALPLLLGGLAVLMLGRAVRRRA